MSSRDDRDDNSLSLEKAPLAVVAVSFSGVSLDLLLKRSFFESSSFLIATG